MKAFHINQRDEGIDLDCVSGALMATNNMQMQTFVTGGPVLDGASVGFDGYNGDLTGDVISTLGVNCGMSTGRAGVIEPIAQGCLNPWDTQQKRVFLPDGVSPTLAGADGGGGRIPGGLLLTAAFNAGAGAKAGSVSYAEQLAPTLKGSPSGNCMPSVLCLNDQGGQAMEVSEEMSGTLRAQEHGHQPLVYENHGIDARYTGPHEIAPTLSCRAGTGSKNLPLVAQEDEQVLCIMGNAIDRKPFNGGNGIGVSEDVVYTLTATDHHAVYSRQRSDFFMENDVVCTESARQHKDATDLVYQKTVGALTSGDSKGPNSQYVSQNKLILDGPLLIRRLVPMECERLQGFPDGWTDIPGASDSARYRALGNSVAIPCVEHLMRRVAMVLMLGFRGRF